jgi:hypothetical protein
VILKPGTDTNQKTVVIVGVQRGGTSMVAGVARELGVNLGKNLGNNHEDPEFLSKDLDKIRSVINTRNQAFDTWGWKMPHSSEYLLELLADIRNPFVIVVIRNLLAMAESQMKRSEAKFENAFKFSHNRLTQVASIIPELTCPTLLVNYEEAVSTPKKFVDEISSFLFLNPTAEQTTRALDMINPEVGYRRLSAETWRHSVSKADGFQAGSLVEASAQRRDVNLTREEGRLQRTQDRAFVEFSGLATKKLVLTMVRETDPTFVRIAVDVGSGYSSNMSEKVSLFRGNNAITIEAERIAGIHIYPQFDGIWSNTKLFRVYT